MLCPCSAILCELQLPLSLFFSCTFIHYFWTHSQCSNATYNSQRGTSNSIGPILKCTCERGASKFKKAAIPQLAGGLASHCSSSASIASHNVLHPELSSGTANFSCLPQTTRGILRKNLESHHQILQSRRHLGQSNPSECWTQNIYFDANFGLHIGQHHVISCSHCVRSVIRIVSACYYPCFFKNPLSQCQCRTQLLTQCSRTGTEILVEIDFRLERVLLGKQTKQTKRTKHRGQGLERRATTSNDKLCKDFAKIVKQVPRRAHHRPSGSVLGERHTRLSPARASEL